MLSQIFVLSPRGDTIVNRDFRGDGIKGAGEIFFRKVKGQQDNGGGDGSDRHVAPIIVYNGTCFVYLKRSGLYFVLVAANIDAPLSLWIELLESVVRVIKDFCGVLSETSVRKNFALVYELIDEIFDFGYPQGLNTGELTNVIRNEPAGFSADATSQGYTSTISQSLSNIGAAGLSQLTNLTQHVGSHAGGPRNSLSGPRTVPSNASQAPISAFKLGGSAGSRLFTGGLSGHPGTNDIFIDILDRIAVDSNADGSIKRFHVDGLLVIKSYMTEPVSLRLGLNEDLVVRSGHLLSATESNRQSHASGSTLDDVLFHEGVSLQDFEQSKALIFSPPQGEFILMRYRINQPPHMRPPVSVHAHLEIVGTGKLQLNVSLRSDGNQRSLAGVAALSVFLPPWVVGGSAELIGSTNGQTVEVQVNNHQIVWGTKRLNLVIFSAAFFYHNSQGICEVGFKSRLSVDLEKCPRIFAQAMSLGKNRISGFDDMSGEAGYGVFPKGSTPNEFVANYFGPINVTFDLPMQSSSKLQIRYLRLANSMTSVAEAPRRWVRYATQTASFTCRF